MSIFSGSTEIQSIFSGSTEVQKVYSGSTLIYTATVWEHKDGYLSLGGWINNTNSLEGTVVSSSEINAITNNLSASGPVRLTGSLNAFYAGRDCDVIINELDTSSAFVVRLASWFNPAQGDYVIDTTFTPNPNFRLEFAADSDGNAQLFTLSNLKLEVA